MLNVSLFVSYIFPGGEDRTSAYNIVERYDTVRDVWIFLPNMKKQRSGAGVAVCNGKIYIAGTAWLNLWRNVLKVNNVMNKFIISEVH